MVQQLKFACDNATVDIPQEMLDQEIKQLRQNVENQAKQYKIDFEMFVQLNGLTMEQFNTEMEKQAKDRVLTSLVIEQVAKQENLTASEAEINAKYERNRVKCIRLTVDQVKLNLTKAAIENEVHSIKQLNLINSKR